MKLLTIDRCPEHRTFWAICIEDGDESGGTRMTPSKCCGRWDRVKAWKLSERDWRELAELALIAAEEAAEPVAPVDAPSGEKE